MFVNHWIFTRAREDKSSPPRSPFPLLQQRETGAEDGKGRERSQRGRDSALPSNPSGIKATSHQGDTPGMDSSKQVLARILSEWEEDVALSPAYTNEPQESGAHLPPHLQ